MKQVDDWEKIKEELKDLIQIEKDLENLSLKFVIKETAKENPFISEFILHGEQLLEELIHPHEPRHHTHILTDSSIEFKEYKGLAELKFKDQNALEAIYELFTNFFFGDLIQQLSEGKKDLLDSVMDKLFE